MSLKDFETQTQRSKQDLLTTLYVAQEFKRSESVTDVRNICDIEWRVFNMFERMLINRIDKKIKAEKAREELLTQHRKRKEIK